MRLESLDPDNHAMHMQLLKNILKDTSLQDIVLSNRN